MLFFPLVALMQVSRPCHAICFSGDNHLALADLTIHRAALTANVLPPPPSLLCFVGRRRACGRVGVADVLLVLSASNDVAAPDLPVLRLTRQQPVVFFLRRQLVHVCRRWHKGKAIHTLERHTAEQAKLRGFVPQVCRAGVLRIRQCACCRGQRERGSTPRGAFESERRMRRWTPEAAIGSRAVS